jgi:hypothetical protein
MLVTRKDFAQQVGASFLSFERGRVIENEQLEATLLAAGAPVDKVLDMEDLVQCPHCKRKFTVAHAVEEEDD